MAGHRLRPTDCGLFLLYPGLRKFHFQLIAPSGWLKVFETGVRVILVICEDIAVFYEMFYIVDRYGKAETTKEYISHIRNADYLAGQVKQRPAGIARIDIGVSLDIDQTLKCPVG